LLESAARWKDHVEVEVVAPNNARETISEFLGDARFTARGWDNRFVVNAGPALAAEYIRRATIAELRPLHADVVVGASHFLPDAAAVHAAARGGAHGVAFIYHLVAGRNDRGLRTLWSQADETLSLRLLRGSAGTVFTSNEETCESLEQRGFKPQRTDVGLELATFRTSDAAHALPVALFVARLVPKKGLADLIEMWPRVLQRVPNARLVIVGSGPERMSAERRIEDLGIGASIEWHGFVSEAVKRELLAQARVFVAPSYEEGWGISVAEAMASKLPVVAYRLPTLDEVFGDGYVPVGKGDVEALAQAVCRLLTDDGEAARAAASGAASVSRYDVGVVAEKELDIILSRSRSR
jgi:glycosyltransferase involved in cell wall biosynthesis